MELHVAEKFVLEKIRLFVDENDIEIVELKNDTRLMGSSGLFDSMDLVRFIVELEEALEDELSLEISLTSEKAMSRSTSPFVNIHTMSNYIKELADG
ncbi:hypothetical protein N9Q68_00320 [Polaribacter sp.]|nr:hypothetical protein [Polaribacter sp.]